jgi:hypothetical protein
MRAKRRSWERVAVFDDFSQAYINRFDDVGGVNDLADFRRIIEERCDTRPVSPPGLADRWIVVAPFDLEFSEQPTALALRI